MSSNIFYTESKSAKNGSIVPVLANGKFFFSAYNPERDIQFYAAAPSVKTSGFILAGGLGDGKHIQALLETNPDAIVMVLEYNKETLEYLLSSIIRKSGLIHNPRVFFTTPETLCADIKNTYIPVLHGSFLYHPVKAWQLAFDESSSFSLKNAIQDTLNDIAADYATQARFGKLMHINVLKNLKLLSVAERSGTLLRESEIFTFAKNAEFKEAAIIGAGPSLDETMPILLKERNRFYIIATDTAYRTLYRNKITADMVVTLDGQESSISHFLGIVSSETVVAADICANAGATRHLYEKGCRLCFFTTGHPLGTLVNNWYRTHCDFKQQKANKNLLQPYYAGYGTVLSAATDIAIKAGFKTIRFFGADFAYKSGKPYTRGTYLDDNFIPTANRFVTAENAFCALCYRTKLSKTDSGFTTPLLSSYKDNLCSFLDSQNPFFDFVSSDTKLSENNLDNSTKSGFHQKKDAQISKHHENVNVFFDYDRFIRFFIEGLKSHDSTMLYSVLPFATWLKEKEKNADISDIYSKAAALTALLRS
ncbi:MAG: DUF115 domain-containing protein [Treponemataceae bacterium]|nr:DUF115 domain-containing protein [Treponemataceae bacterium]